MTPVDRGSKAFAVFDLAIKVVWVSVVVMGIMLIAIALSGADMGRLDDHPVFQYRMIVAPALIVGYLAIDRLQARRRARAAADAAAAPGRWARRHPSAALRPS